MARKSTCSNAVLGGLAALGLLVGVTGQAKADYTYTTIDFPGLPSGTISQAWGINTSGQIVGQYTDANDNHHGFLYSGGSYTSFDVPVGFGRDTIPFGINDPRQIVGQYQDANGKPHGFLLSAGSYATLDVPGAFSTEPHGINNAGQIVGNYDAGGTTHGFLRNGTGYTTLDAPGSGITLPTGSTISAKLSELTCLVLAARTASCSAGGATPRLTCLVHSGPGPMSLE